jgi:hypothetical protein
MKIFYSSLTVFFMILCTQAALAQKGIPEKENTTASVHKIPIAGSGLGKPRMLALASNGL